MSASNLSFALRISAQDQTRAGLSSALGQVKSLARSVGRGITVPLRIGMSAVRGLRDINLGLRPVLAGMDDLIERGAALEVQHKAFAALTATRGAATERMAQSIIRAASGTIRYAEALQIANRALGSGIKFDQLLTAVDFISKKSIATGRSARESLDKVITGLSRGSTLFLDDFGILVDGVDGVKRAFDAIRGAGAFDQLGPAAQKAEIIRQAIGEMAGQMGRMGVTGRETIFVWSQIKNSIGNASDRLVLAVAKSKALREGLRTVRDVLGGLERHFAGGGGFGELLFGNGGQGGALNIGGALLLDLGENLGRGIGGALLKAIGRGLDFLIEDFGPRLKAMGRDFALAIVNELQAKFGWLLRGKFAEMLGGIGEQARGAATAVGGLVGGGEAAGGAMIGAGGLAAGGGALLLRRLLRPKADAFGHVAQGRFGGWLAQRAERKAVAKAAAELTGGAVAKRGAGKLVGKVAGKVAWPLAIADLAWESWQAVSAGIGLNRALKAEEDMTRLANEQMQRLHEQRQRMAGQRAASQPWNFVMPMGAGAGVAAPTLGQRIAGLGDSLLGGVGFERTRAAAGAFMGQFSSGQTAADQARARAMAYAAAQQGGSLRLTRFARERQQRIIAANQRRLSNIAGGGEFVRQNALREAGMEADALRRAGFRVTPSVRRDLIQQAIRRQIEARSSGPREAIDAATGVLSGDKAAGLIGPAAARLRSERDMRRQDSLIDAITDLTRRIDGMMSALLGSSERVARAGA